MRDKRLREFLGVEEERWGIRAIQNGKIDDMQKDIMHLYVKLNLLANYLGLKIEDSPVITKLKQGDK